MDGLRSALKSSIDNLASSEANASPAVESVRQSVIPIYEDGEKCSYCGLYRDDAGDILFVKTPEDYRLQALICQQCVKVAIELIIQREPGFAGEIMAILLSKTNIPALITAGLCVKPPTVERPTPGEATVPDEAKS